MDTLTRHSGLTPRQVRRCISIGIIPPPTGKGPGARYSHEALQKLKLVSKFMKERVEPKNRPMRLKEIKATIDGLRPDQIEEILDGLPFAFVDDQEETEPIRSARILDVRTGEFAEAPIEGDLEDEELDREFLDLHETDPRDERPEISPTAMNLLAEATEMCGYRPTGHLRRLMDAELIPDQMTALLKRLLSRLEDVTEQDPDPIDPIDPIDSNEETWSRVSSGGVIEIHVKSPENEFERSRLVALRESLERLIDSNRDPDDERSRGRRDPDED
jgi:DNA-binding transcriptional MerR regulator